MNHASLVLSLCLAFTSLIGDAHANDFQDEISNRLARQLLKIEHLQSGVQTNLVAQYNKVVYLADDVCQDQFVTEQERHQLRRALHGLSEEIADSTPHDTNYEAHHADEQGYEQEPIVEEIEEPEYQEPAWQPKGRPLYDQRRSKIIW